MKFPEILTSERKRRGLTLKILGHYVGMNDNKIWRFEKGIQSPKQEDLEPIAKYFDVSIQYLLGEDLRPSPPKTDNILILYFEHRLKPILGQILTEEETNLFMRVCDLLVEMLKDREKKKRLSGLLDAMSPSSGGEGLRLYQEKDSLKNVQSDG